MGMTYLWFARINTMKLPRILFVFILLLSFSGFGITLSKQAISVESEKEDKTTDVSEPRTKETYCLAKVIKIISDLKEELPGGNNQRAQQLVIKVLTGQDKGKIRSTENIIPDNPAFAIVGAIGKKYLVTKVENIDNGQEDYFLVDYNREYLIWILTGIFLITLIIVGGFKGLRAIASLVLTIGLVAFVLLPSIEKGINPLLSTVLVSILSTALTMMFVAGLNKKSLASTLGTGIGVCISGLIATLVIKIAPLSGLASNEAMILWGNQLYQVNFKGLLASGMIISCLGAVMDVAISVASSIQEIKIANLNYTFNDLFKSGMNVGKDIMGTMTNTLVLAYTEMALPLLLLISHEKNPAKFLNLELVVSEVTAAISGSVGLIIAIPATALIMSYLVDKKK